MARVLLVDDDARMRARAEETLATLGHTVEIATTAHAAQERLAAGDVDLVIADVVLEGGEGLDLAVGASLLAQRVPVILVSRMPSVLQAAQQRARADSIALAGVLPKPLEAEETRLLVDAALDMVRAASTTRGPSWLGEEFLRTVDGDAEEFPPVRVAYLAARLEATGQLEVAGPTVRARIGFKAGKVVYVDGVPGLLASLDATLPAGPLGTQIGMAVARGVDPTRAMEVAASTLGDVLVGWTDAPPEEAWVSWIADWKAPPGSFPLPRTLQRLVVDAHRTHATPTALDARWAHPAPTAGVRARLPEDAPQDRWGLDATALRILREASAPVGVTDLARRVAPDATRLQETWRALDLLRVLGLLVPVEVEPTLLQSPAETPREPVREPPEAPTGAAPPEPAPPGDDGLDDPRAARFREARERMAGQVPLEILELSEKRAFGEEEVSAAFRDISKRYHPDVYFNAPPAVRELAEVCFAHVQSAYEALKAPGGLAEAKRWQAARNTGAAFVGEKDHNAARMAFRRGEALWRNRDWAGADAQFLDAFQRDPDTWPHALYHAHAGMLTQRLSGDKALALVEALLPKHPKHAAEILTVAGHVCKLAGRQPDALTRYRKAVEVDATAHEALREIRLAERRAPPPPPEPKPLFGGIFGGKKS
jgi:DNA-binding response OmpR family regulator